MKNVLIKAFFVVSLLVSCPVGASNVPVVIPSTTMELLSSKVNSLVSAPGTWHKEWPKITGIAVVTVVAVIAYKMGSEKEIAKSKKENLI